VPRIGSAFLDDFPGAMFALWLVIDPGPLTGQICHATVSALFLPGYVVPKTYNVKRSVLLD